MDDDEQPEDDQPQAEDEDEGPSPAPPTSPPPTAADEEEGAQDDSLVTFDAEETTADVLEMLPEDTNRDIQKMIDDTAQRLDNLETPEQGQPTASEEPPIADLLGGSDVFQQPTGDAPLPPPISSVPIEDMFSFGGDSGSGFDQTGQIPSFDASFPALQPELAPPIATGDLLGGDFSFSKPDEGDTGETGVVEESTLIDLGLGGPEQ